MRPFCTQAVPLAGLVILQSLTVDPGIRYASLVLEIETPPGSPSFMMLPANGTPVARPSRAIEKPPEPLPAD